MSEAQPGDDRVEVGPRRQPVVAERASVLLTQLALASLASLAGVVCHLMGSRTLMRLEETSRLWPMVGNLTSVLLALVCVFQWYAWHQAQREWTGRADVALGHLLAPSAVGRWVALACGVAGPVAAWCLFDQTAPTEQAHWWALAGGILTILAAGFGGIHQLDPAGPPGVLPARLSGSTRVDTTGPHDPIDPEADTIILRR